MEEPLRQEVAGIWGNCAPKARALTNRPSKLDVSTHREVSLPTMLNQVKHAQRTIVNDAHMCAACGRVAAETGVWNENLPNHVLLNAYPPGGGIMVGSFCLDDPALLLLSMTESI